MNVGDIFSDSLAYPFHNIKALIIFAVIAIIGAIIGGASVVSLMGALSTKGLSSAAFTGLSIIGIIVFVLILFLIEGYALDIIKYGIERKDEGPGIDIARQISNAIKLVIVDIVYYLIPVIISFVLGIFLKNWILSIISLILLIVFTFANFMAKCRLAKTDDLGEALAIGEAIGDISKVGFGKIIITILLIVIILIIAAIVLAYIYKLNNSIGSILCGCSKSG